jgi:hypothetical protein
MAEEEGLAIENSTAAEPAAEPATEPAAEPAIKPINPEERRKKITLQTSLIFVSHPDIVKLIQGTAQKQNSSAVLKQILYGATDTSPSVWTPGTPQQMEGIEALDLSSYTLDFNVPIRIQDFHDGLNRTAYRFSFMHYRRPGDPVGRDYIKIQATEDAQDKAVKEVTPPAAAAESAEEVLESQPILTGEAAAEKKAEIESSEPLGESGVKEINPRIMQGDALDENLGVVTAKIQKDPPPGTGMFADFYMVTGSGLFKAYRSRGKTERDVIENIQMFLENPEF